MLSVSHLRKSFDRTKPPALSDLSFEVEPGKICGLLGHNGAGKSTALGIILGMVYPDRGEVTIAGHAVQGEREKAISNVGAIFETPAFYEYLSGWHNLKILSSYSGGVSRKLMEETVEWVGLTDRVRDRVSTYSHGMRQRLALAQALLPRPQILILDEPTDGLDPEGIVEFRQQVLELRERLGLTVLLSSHLLAEVEQVCDEVVILQGGEKVYEGQVRSVSDDEVRYEIEAGDHAALVRAWGSLGGRIEGEDFVIASDRSPSDLIEALVSAEVRVERFGKKEDSLEALYLRVSKEGGGGDAP